MDGHRRPAGDQVGLPSLIGDPFTQPEPLGGLLSANGARLPSGQFFANINL